MYSKLILFIKSHLMSYNSYNIAYYQLSMVTNSPLFVFPNYSHLI